MINPPYSVLYVDPPWSYDNKRTGGNLTRMAQAQARGDLAMVERYKKGCSGAAQKYSTLTLDELKSLPIGDLAAPNAVLALWATVPLGGDPYEVIRAWGFTYKTAFFWVKSGRPGMGHYFRGNVEPLLFAIRGKVAPFRLKTQKNYIELPPLRHSSKPSYFRELIERATQQLEGRRLELFAREQATGWDSTGLEIDGIDIRSFAPKIVEVFG